MIRTAAAFIRRDFIIHSSYKFAFVSELLTSVFPVLSFYYIARLMGDEGATALAPYGGSYFPFVMVGIAITQYFMLALSAFATTVRRDQMAGCLEAMLSTRTRPETAILLSSLYSFVVKLVHVVMVFAIGGALLGVDYGASNFLSAAVILVLTVAAFSGLGILSASVLIVLKKGDPIEWVLGSLGSLLGGALFPVSVMPRWMQKVGAVLPITYSLEAMRLAILRGESLVALWRPVGVLAGMSVVLLPVSMWCFAKAVEKGRRDGSLMQY